MPCSDSKPKDPEAYLRRAPEAMRSVGEELRALVRRRAPALREAIKWAFICYEGRRLVCCIGVCKGHASLAFFRGAELADPRGVLKHGSTNAAMRTFKATAVADIPARALEALLDQAVRLDATAAAQPPRRATRPEIPVPDDFARALAEVPEAQRRFAELPRYCRREYLDWIVSAKRSETRERRLREAVRLIAAGRKDH